MPAWLLIFGTNSFAEEVGVMAADTIYEEGILNNGVFGEALTPTRAGKASTDEDKILKVIMDKYQGSGKLMDTGGLEEYIQLHPHSRWNPSLLLSLGRVYYLNGYFVRAINAWSNSWSAVRHTEDIPSRELGDRAVAELLHLLAKIGRYDEMEAIIAQIGDHQPAGSAGVKYDAALRGLNQMKTRPDLAFKCGPYALGEIYSCITSNRLMPSAVADVSSSTQGTSLSEVAGLASLIGLDMVPAVRLGEDAEIIVPSVMHWRVGHFAALVRRSGEHYLVRDPTFGDEFWITKEAIDSEASGSYLVPRDKLTDGWMLMEDERAATVWGRGAASSEDTDAIKPYDEKCLNPEDCFVIRGVPFYNVHAMLVSLNIGFRPFSYDANFGPNIGFNLTYNQRDINQPSSFNYGNVGPLWTHDWLSYVEEANPSAPLSQVRLYLRGGGVEVYKNFNSSTESFDVHPYSGARLSLLGSSNGTNHFKRTLPDGSREFYTLSGGGLVNRRAFLTHVYETSHHDGYIQFQYDALLRVTNVVDAGDRRHSVLYHSTNIYLIKRVTDPQGNYVELQYDSFKRISSIRDVFGQTNIFMYATNGFVRSMVTPYGETKYEHGAKAVGNDRWLEVETPLGERERFEHNHDYTYYWDSYAYSQAGGASLAYSNAVFWHWLRKGDNPSMLSGTLRTRGRPSEPTRYYRYVGQDTNFTREGNTSFPSEILQILSGGVTQRFRYTYNSMGRVTSEIDPLGRNLVYAYATNLVDVISIRSTGSYDGFFIQNASYSNNLPVHVMRAVGGSVKYEYDAKLLLAYVTNASGSWGRFYYNSSGALTQGVLSAVGTNHYYRDQNDRLEKYVGADGYVFTNEYDVYGRLARIKYSDGTYRQYSYTKYDMTAFRDRLGRWTHIAYDPLRRPVSIRDWSGRVTRMEWCGCGGMTELTDPAGRRTEWRRDASGRVAQKVYPDGSSIQYFYDEVGLLNRVVDPLGQSMWLTYYLDGQVDRISWSNAVNQTPAVKHYYDPRYGWLDRMDDGQGSTLFSRYLPTNGTPSWAGLVQAVDGPLSNDTISLHYDVAGRVTNRTLNGVAVNVSYDVAGRVVSSTSSLGTNSIEYAPYSFRPVRSEYAGGLLARYEYAGSANDYRLIRMSYTNSVGSHIRSFAYEYDSEGMITRLTKLRGAFLPEVMRIIYDESGQLAAAVSIDGGAGSAPVHTESFHYDLAGNRVGAQHGARVNYTVFDKLNRAVHQSPGGVFRISGQIDEPGRVWLDAREARVAGDGTFVGEGSGDAHSTSVFEVAAADFSGNVATSVFAAAVTPGEAETYAYDVNGNLLSITSRQSVVRFRWDAADRLISITEGSRESRFSYDGMGRRVRRVEVDGAATNLDVRYVWSGLELVEERSATGAVVRKRYFPDGFASINGSQTGLHYYVRDHLGSVTDVLDANGSVLASYDNSPYGVRTLLSGNDISEVGFTGHFHHEPSGLVIAPYRFYDPKRGRWLSRDPIGIAGGINLYAYVNNNPINYVDPLGLQSADTSFVDDELARRAAVRQGVADLGRGIQTGFDAVAGLNPVVGAGEALSGKSASGQTLSGTDRGLAAAGLFGGVFKGFRAAKCAKNLLNEGDALLAVVKEGKVIAQTRDIALSHASFVERSLGQLPEGAHVVTVGKFDGKVRVLNSKTFHGNQAAAPKSVADAVMNVYE